MLKLRLPVAVYIYENRDARIAHIHAPLAINSIESVKWLDLILRLGFASQLYLPIACPSVPPYITADGHKVEQ